jgi:hypothetical protein
MSTRGWAIPLGVLALLVFVWEVLPSGSDGPRASLASSSKAVTLGQHLTLSGNVGSARALPVKLYGRTYPDTVGTLIATKRASADGSFSFAYRPERDTSYYVQASNGASSVPVFVDVKARALVATKTVFGQAVVRVRVEHPPDLDWDGAPVRWAFASNHAQFVSAPVTRTVRVAPDVDVLTARATLKPGPFRWKACFQAPGADDLEDPDPPPNCHGQGFSGSGSIPRVVGGFPTRASIAAAERYLAGRQGRHALAVINTKGQISGVDLDKQFITGSVVKAMLLVAYLRRLNAMGQHQIDTISNSLLAPMIEQSDNTAATHVWEIVGDSGLMALARTAGMTHFEAPATASWGFQWATALLTARDQARFFYEMDSLIPREFDRYARFLLSNITSSESWGIPAVARPLGYKVFFKGGWRPSPDIFLVHQIARLEKNGQKFAIAIMTDGDADEGYGIDTLQGATRALLGTS